DRGTHPPGGQQHRELPARRRDGGHPADAPDGDRGQHPGAESVLRPPRAVPPTAAGEAGEAAALRVV
ncbi:MAG: hypothetical protein AVDCRST_MAG89-3016, partial [uncultured Gemmatimonadetes bacterium]